MKNEYQVLGDTSVIFIRRRNGEVVEVLIDTEDIHIAQSMPGAWCSRPDARTGAYYICAYNRAKDLKYILHRMITNAPSGLVVDHINHNTLDNRRANLRVVSAFENRQNLKGPFANNRSSGVRGVSWHKIDQVWIAQYTKYGKRFYVGRFKTLKEAEKAIKQERDSKTNDFLTS